jgi:hypothetical protein
MATPDLLFPMYDILVNTIFGSVGLSLAALAAVMAIILALCRTSWVFILYWLMFYIMVAISLYIGALGLVISFIIVAAYFVVQIVRIVYPDR